MLFHVTMTHTPDNCPAYNRENMPAVLASMEKIEDVAKELNVKIHSFLWAAPEHVAFAVVECDGLSAVAQCFNTIPITHDFRVTAVENVENVVKMGRAMMERANK